MHTQGNDCTHCSIVQTVLYLVSSFRLVYQVLFVAFYTHIYTDKDNIRNLLVNTEELKRNPCATLKKTNHKWGIYTP